MARPLSRARNEGSLFTETGEEGFGGYSIDLLPAHRASIPHEDDARDIVPSSNFSNQVPIGKMHRATPSRGNVSASRLSKKSNPAKDVPSVPVRRFDSPHDHLTGETGAAPVCVDKVPRLSTSPGCETGASSPSSSLRSIISLARFRRDSQNSRDLECLSDRAAFSVRSASVTSSRDNRIQHELTDPTNSQETASVITAVKIDDSSAAKPKSRGIAARLKSKFSKESLHSSKDNLARYAQRTMDELVPPDYVKGPFMAGYVSNETYPGLSRYNLKQNRALESAMDGDGDRFQHLINLDTAGAPVPGSFPGAPAVPGTWEADREEVVAALNSFQMAESLGVAGKKVGTHYVPPTKDGPGILASMSNDALKVSPGGASAQAERRNAGQTQQVHGVSVNERRPMPRAGSARRSRSAAPVVGRRRSASPWQSQLSYIPEHAEYQHDFYAPAVAAISRPDPPMERHLAALEMTSQPVLRRSQSSAAISRPSTGLQYKTLPNHTKRAPQSNGMVYHHNNTNGSQSSTVAPREPLQPQITSFQPAPRAGRSMSLDQASAMRFAQIDFRELDYRSRQETNRSRASTRDVPSQQPGPAQQQTVVDHHGRTYVYECTQNSPTSPPQPAAWKQSVIIDRNGQTYAYERTRSLSSQRSSPRPSSREQQILVDRHGRPYGYDRTQSLNSRASSQRPSIQHPNNHQHYIPSQLSYTYSLTSDQPIATSTQQLPAHYYHNSASHSSSRTSTMRTRTSTSTLRQPARTRPLTAQAQTSVYERVRRGENPYRRPRERIEGVRSVVSGNMMSALHGVRYR